MRNSDGKGVRFKNKEYKLDREDDEDHLTTRMTNWNIIFDIIESPPCQNIAFLATLVALHFTPVSKWVSK